MRSLATCFALCALLIPMLPAQGPAYVPDNTPATGSGNVIPFGQSSSFAPGYSYIGRIPASFLCAAGAQTHITEIAFTPISSGTWNCATVRMGLGHVPNPLPVPFSFPVGGPGSFQDFTTIYDSAVQGPFSWTVTANTWSPMGFAALGGTGFCWDGVRDIAFYVTYQNSVVSWTGDFHRTDTEPFRAYGAGYNAAASAGSGANGLKMRLDFGPCPSPAPTNYETNDAAATMTFNGVNTGPYCAAVTTTCFNSNVTINVGSTVPATLWEAAYNPVPVVPGTSPFALTTPGGQFVNLDLGAGLTFLFGGAFPALAPLPGSFTASFNSGFANFTLSAQAVVVNPAHADGVSLSQACQLASGVSLGAGPFAGPTTDNGETIYNVGCIRGPYGVTFSQIVVQANGRMFFGGLGSTGTAPSATTFASNPPSFGVWTNFNPALGGSITVTQPSPGVIRADYTAVPYATTAIANTFALIWDSINGIATIDGLSGVVTSTTTINQLIGITGGNLVGATQPAAQAVYGPPPLFGTTTTPTEQIYRLAPAGTVAPGVNRIDFVPNGIGNFDFISS